MGSFEAYGLERSAFLGTNLMRMPNRNHSCFVWGLEEYYGQA